MDLFHLTTKLVIGFFLLFVLVKVMGKKIINQVTPFTFIAAVVLGELLGNALYQEKVQIQYVIYSMTLWALLLVFVEMLGQKSMRLQTIFEGKPSILIRNGIIDREQLKKNRLTLRQLQSLLRQSETFSIREVAYCYLETDGSLSILKKSPYQKLTQEDINLSPASVHIPLTIIRDGELLLDALRDLDQSKEWLFIQLQNQGVMDYRDVFLAEWLETDGLFIQTFAQVVQKKG
ncbi:DUF421 domain-containing protein [Bacillus sp. 165]|uniref:DUF421 domain-containing protein n=1 Tax=Bacillus sp. 165 TaxID=1529117 RepID=UPI001ADBEB84|nr:DUF421 domain-containing protein [Bacillus sp. 165]MBO9130915.1 DUF421 domain-containing protein [Bacillus sp. 165]